MFALVLLSIGCGDTAPETLVDELRVMASVAEPPEVHPHMPFSYETYFANPEEVDATAMTWVCTNLGSGCLEAAGGAQSIATEALEGLAPTWQRTLSVSPSLMGVVQGGPITATQVWTLYCADGVCPVIDAAAGVDPTEPWPESLQDDLSNPTSWMADLPMTGVSLAYQLLTTSLSDDPHQNPTLTPDADVPTSLKRDKSFSIRVQVDGEFSEQAQLYNYITGGGFKNPSTFVTAGDTIELEGTAPKKGDEARIWIVLVDGLGGMAVWTEQFSLR